MILNILTGFGLNNFWGYLTLKIGYLGLAFAILGLMRRMIAGAYPKRRYPMVFGFGNVLLLAGFLVLELKWPLWVWLLGNMELIPAMIMADILVLLLLSGYLMFFLYQSYLLTQKIRVLQEGFGAYLLQYGYIWLSVLNLIIFLRVDYFYMPLIPGNLPWHRRLLIEAVAIGAFLLLMLLALALRRSRMVEAGPELRELVDEVAGRFGIKVGVVRIWRLDGVKNAFSGSILLRSIIVSENLLNSASRDDMRMILGHECAHLKKRDLWVRVGLIFGLVWLGSHFAGDFGEWSLFVFFVYGILAFLVYQFLSRYQELRADRLAARLVGDSEAMIAALTRNFGIGPRFGLITRLLVGHPGMAERVERLQELNQVRNVQNEEH